MRAIEVKALVIILAVFLFLAGLFLIQYSSRSIEKLNQTKRYTRMNSWNITGYFEKGEILALDLYAGRDWSIGPVPAEPLEPFPVYINISVRAPDGGLAIFHCNYSGEVQSSWAMQTLFLTPVNVSVIYTNTSCLDVGSCGVISEAPVYAMFGRAEEDGNFTVTVNEDVLIWFPLSDDPPMKMDLLGYVRFYEFPYASFFYLGVSLFVLDGIILFIYMVLRIRRVAGFQRRRLSGGRSRYLGRR